jgi:hypothetical protein
MIVQKSVMTEETATHILLSRQGLMSVCFAPAVIYILIHGQTMHFVYLFILFIALKVLLSADEMCRSNSQLFVGQTTCSMRVQRSSKSDVNKFSTLLTPKTSSGSRKPHPEYTRSSGSSESPAPTAIVSPDLPNVKTRRALLNKVCPEKLDDLSAKLTESFKNCPSGNTEHKEIVEFASLVFAAASRQSQYVGVFAELLQKVLADITSFETAEAIVSNQCRHSWTQLCLTPVEQSKGWDLLSDDDKSDARTRHREKQMTVAEFCGLLASFELIPASAPLSWLESLLVPIRTTAINQGRIEKESPTEAVIEVICSAVRGLGPSELQGLFTDLDQERFDRLCSGLFSLPVRSSRVKCVLQDLRELRESGWSKLPTWKRALQPTKRDSSRTSK